MPEPRKALVVCKAGDDSRTVTVKINTNNLVVCDEWKKCPHHGGSHCEELGMHEEVLRGNAFKGGAMKGLTHMLNEDKETFMRRMRRSFK